MPNPDNIKGKGFKNNPQNINKNGAPPRLLSTITAELKAKGYERATANQVADAFETLMNVPEDELRKMVNEGKSPMSLRIVGKAMLTAKGWEVLQAMLDRAHGKAKLSMDVSEKVAVKVTHKWGGKSK